MVIDFSNIDLHERPTLILKNAGDIPLGVLGFAYNVELECNYNEISVLHFTMPSKVDNEDVPCYEDLVGMRIIEIPGIGCFTLISPDEINDGVRKYKECKAYSLEYEFSYKKISMAKDTYKFWDNNPAKRNGTILGMIMESMPSWSVSSVSDNLINKYRTFEVDNENLYQFIKDTIQQSYGCIFDFDTLNRTVIIHDVDVEVSDTQVYLSLQNLVKEIEIHEDIENMVTRLDVSGADGVNIRDVNPTGTNSIINLDYYMDTKNFSQQLIDKYYAWKTLCADSGPIYYAKSINHSLTIMRLNTERAAMTDLDGELTSLDNQRAVVIQSISQGIMTQADLDAINIQYAAKQSEIYVKNNLISELESEQTREMQEIRAIVDACSFDKYFTNDEHRQLDRYIRDGEISESSFVSFTSVYTDEGTSKQITGALLSITDASIEQTISSDKTIFDCRGGTLSVAGFGAAELIYGVLSNGADNAFIFTAALSSGTLSGASFQSGSLTITGSISGSISSSTQDINVTVSGYAYFTLNPSEYQRRSIAWDLYEYGQIMSVKLSQPTYSFSISSANFLALEEFRAFKNQLGLGKKIYLDNDGDILKPICIGANFSFEDLTMLELKFGDSYVRTDTEFKLADILEQSTSTGRTVETGKFNFEEFTQSGASTGIREYMRSAIDLAKNRIIESSGQAISMDRAGLRLRKWKNETDQTFDDEQIWLNNNSVLMTDDNWKTAKMAIGKFRDPNFDEDMWGILAPMVVGTLLAGESLVIESAKTDGSSGVSVFRVDGDGCRMYNGDISVIGENGTLWTYTVSSNTNVYSQMNTSSTIVDTISATGTAVVTKRIASSGVTWGYVMTTTGHTGWIQLTGATLKTTETGCSHIVLHPDVGIVIGRYPVISKDDAGNYSVNQENAKLWIDVLGNLYMSGYATFSSLSTPGQTVIDGGNITTGTITATKLSRSVTDSIAAAASLAAAAQSTADSKVTTYYQTAAPASASNGDLWIDIDDGNKLYRWNGSNWINIQDTAIQSALTAAGDAQSIADSKIVTFAQASAPRATDVGDLWVDTDDNNRLYRWDGTRWADVRDSGIAAAASLAAAAQSTADSAVYEQQTIYKSQAANGAAPGKVTTWITNTTGNQNIWTTKRPIYNSAYPILYVASQMRTVSEYNSGSNCHCTTPVVDQTTTVIDGGHITTGTIDASLVSVIGLSANNIISGQLSADRIDATNLKVSAANITGTLVIGQLPDTVAEQSDIPTKVSQLTNDSGFQNSSQVTTITNNTIKTTDVTATNLKVKAANIDGTLTIGQLPGTVAQTGDAIGRQQTVYIRQASHTAPAAVTQWVVIQSDVRGTWTTEIPTYWDEYPYLFYAVQTQTISQMNGNTCSCTTPLRDHTTTIISGNSISTGYLSADRIQGGTLILGGDGNVSGQLQLKNASGSTVCQMNSNGVTIKSGDITITGQPPGYSFESKVSLSNGELIFYESSSSTSPVGRIYGVYGGAMTLEGKVIVKGPSHNTLSISDNGVSLTATDLTVYKVVGSTLHFGTGQTIDVGVNVGSNDRKVLSFVHGILVGVR